jgi:hypothetical protein
MTLHQPKDNQMQTQNLPTTPCTHCDGEGKHGAADQWVGGSIHGGWADSFWTCKHCEGTGIEPVCEECGGTGEKNWGHTNTVCPECEQRATEASWAEQRAKAAASAHG